MIKVSNINKLIGGFALIISDLDLPSFGFVLLQGPNGSGKSTLFGILSGRDTDYDGSFYLDGELLGKNELMDYADAYVAYCPQDSLIFDDETSLKNVLLPYSRKNKKEAIGILNQLGLGNVIYSKARDLSSGEKQRVAIARALYSKRPVLLFDEPFSLLDGESRDKAVKALIAASKENLVICSTNEDIPDGLLDGEDVGRIVLEQGRLKEAAFPDNQKKIAAPQTFKPGFAGRLKEIFVGNKLFYAILGLCSLIFSIWSTFDGMMSTSFFGTVFEEPPLGYRYSYQKLAYVETSDVLTQNGLMEGNPILLKNNESFRVLNGEGEHRIVTCASMTDSFVNDDYWLLDNKVLLAGNWPKEEREIALPTGLLNLYYDIEPGTAWDSFLGKEDNFFEYRDSYHICGIFDAPIPNWAEDLYFFLRGGYRGDGDLIFYDQDACMFGANYYLAVVYSFRSSGGYYFYPPTEHNKQIAKLVGHTSDIAIATKSFSTSISPMDRLNDLETYYWINAFASICLLSFPFSYYLSNRRRFMLLRFGGMARNRLASPLLAAFSIVIGGPILLGLGLGIGLSYLVEAIYFSTLIMPGVDYIVFDYSSFLVTTLFGIAILLLSFAFLYFVLLKKNLSKDLAKIKEK